MRNRAAGVLATALGLAAIGPGVANALPGATNIYPGECPPGGSDAVRCVQQVLNDYTGHPLDVDGCYGPKSQAAVRDLQSFFGLDTDTIIGPMTGDAVDTVILFNGAPADVDAWNWGCYFIVPTLD